MTLSAASRAIGVEVLGLLVLLVLAVTVTIGAGFRRNDHRAGAWSGLSKRKVVVNLKTGDPTFRGVLWETVTVGRGSRRRLAFVVLRSVEAMETGSTVVRPVDGEVVIEAANVDYLQFADWAG